MIPRFLFFLLASSSSVSRSELQPPFLPRVFSFLAALMDASTILIIFILVILIRSLWRCTTRRRNRCWGLLTIRPWFLAGTLWLRGWWWCVRLCSGAGDGSFEEQDDARKFKCKLSILLSSIATRSIHVTPCEL